jgi:UDP-N-acetyl-D-galactosamine dehydrogenase
MTASKLSNSNFFSTVKKKKLKIGVIGLGYVGLPLAIEFSKKYPTVGFDKDENRINELINGNDKTLQISAHDLNTAKNLKLIFDEKNIASCNIYIVTIPTPVDKFNKPDLYPLSSASKTVGKMLKKNDIVIYESTVYPGATEEFCIPILEKESGLKYNLDFFCGYSPERINPGDKKHSLTTITKVTSGSDEKTANFVDELYNSIIPAGTHKASSIAVAEAAKVIENIQRDVNIALINELSMIFNKLDLDTNDVLEAAGTKWNFLPFRPGLVGGHCIGVDPYYLTHKAIEIGYNPEIILAGRRINEGMGQYIADCTIKEMTKAGINPVGAKVAVFGLTFKENCPDLRNTKIPDIINSLLSFGCEISVTDPYVDLEEAENIYDLKLVNENNINKCDTIIVAVAHEHYKKMSVDEWKKIFNGNGVFMDVKGIADKELFSGTNISYWRL